MCAVFVRQKTQEMYQSSIYLSIKYRAQKQLLMNSKEGENLCRLSDTLWFVFLFSLLSPSSLSFFPSTIKYWSLCARMYAKNWEYSG